MNEKTDSVLKAGVLTVSDAGFRGEREDTSGAVAEERLRASGFDVVRRELVPDERDVIAARLREMAGDCALIVTTGGTGFSPRDVTPEAVRPLFRRELDGFAILFHQASLGTVGVATLQSRACAGQIDETFIFCLPGSTGACRDGWDLVLALELDSRYRPCSLAGQIPRLRSLCA